MAKKTIEAKTKQGNYEGNNTSIAWSVIPVPPDTDVTISYDTPEVEIRPGQRWTKYGTTWTVQQNGKWWQIVTESHQVTLIRESDSFDAVACYATIEEDGK